MSKFVTKDYFAKLCEDAYDLNADSMIAANAQLKANYVSRLPKATFIFSSNGAIDPWFPYGINKSVPDREIYSYTIEGLGHVADAQPRSSNETRELTVARNYELKILGKWINRLSNSKDSAVPFISLIFFFLLAFVLFAH